MPAALPLTYSLRIVCGILLRGNAPVEIAPNLWPTGIIFTGRPIG